MNYFAFLAILPPKAEAILPQRKHGAFLAFMLLAVLSLCSGPLLAMPVETALQQQVETELAQYLQQLGVKAQQQDIQ
ncbi:hypothetical protein, partial [Rheinheimera sp.]|uniref:hypothetical protein n=1 Tax=Rheinheimera sp. TaxID=1869214 RepID=UPI0037CB23D8